MMRKNIFNELNERNTIFKNEQVFSPEYLPEEVLFRDKEMYEIAYHFLPLLKGTCPPSFLTIFGRAGVGKTTIAKHVLEQFSNYSQKAKGIYINMMREGTRYSFLITLLESLGFPTSRRGKAPDELIAITKDLIKEEGMKISVVLDEVDRIAKRELELVLSDLNEIKKEVGCAALLIANNLSFFNKLDERTKALCLAKTMHMKRYNPQEVKKILLERAKEGFLPSVFDEEIISLVAAYTMKRGGNLRFGITLLWEAGKKAEMEGDKLKIQHVKNAIADAEAMLREMERECLSPEERKVLDVLEHYCPMTTGELYKKLPYNERSIRNYLKKLEEKGFIKTIPIFSSSGNTRMIELV